MKVSQTRGGGFNFVIGNSLSDVHGRPGPENMADRRDYATIELPIMLRDRLKRHLQHPRQPCHDFIEDLLDYWLDAGGYDGRPKSRL